MSSKIIIIVTVILLLVSFSILFVIETKNHNYDYKKSWSVVYFENPRDNSLDFVIENHQGEKAKYDYEIFIGDDKAMEGEIEIEPGAEQKISPTLGDASIKNNRVSVIINCKDAEYKIYKEIE